MATGNQMQPQQPAQEPSKAWVAKRKPTMRERYAEIQELLDIAQQVIGEIREEGMTEHNWALLGGLETLIRCENQAPQMFR